jgi:hypothetical protein
LILGKRQGQTCDKKVKKGFNKCDKHLNARYCQATIKKGKRENQSCNVLITTDNEFCSKHSKKDKNHPPKSQKELLGDSHIDKSLESSIQHSEYSNSIDLAGNAYSMSQESSSLQERDPILMHQIKDLKEKEVIDFVRSNYQYKEDGFIALGEIYKDFCRFKNLIPIEDLMLPCRTISKFLKKHNYITQKINAGTSLMQYCRTGSSATLSSSTMKKIRKNANFIHENKEVGVGKGPCSAMLNNYNFTEKFESVVSFYIDELRNGDHLNFLMKSCTNLNPMKLSDECRKRSLITIANYEKKVNNITFKDDCLDHDNCPYHSAMIAGITSKVFMVKGALTDMQMKGTITDRKFVEDFVMREDLLALLATDISKLPPSEVALLKVLNSIVLVGQEALCENKTNSLFSEKDPAKLAAIIKDFNLDEDVVNSYIFNLAEDEVKVNDIKGDIQIVPEIDVPLKSEHQSKIFDEHISARVDQQSTKSVEQRIDGSHNDESSTEGFLSRVKNERLLSKRDFHISDNALITGNFSFQRLYQNFLDVFLCSSSRHNENANSDFILEEDLSLFKIANQLAKYTQFRNIGLVPVEKLRNFDEQRVDCNNNVFESDDTEVNKYIATLPVRLMILIENESKLGFFLKFKRNPDIVEHFVPFIKQMSGLISFVRLLIFNCRQDLNKSPQFRDKLLNDYHICSEQEELLIYHEHNFMKMTMENVVQSVNDVIRNLKQIILETLEISSRIYQPSAELILKLIERFNSINRCKGLIIKQS